MLVEMVASSRTRGELAWMILQLGHAVPPRFPRRRCEEAGVRAKSDERVKKVKSEKLKRYSSVFNYSESSSLCIC